MNHESKDINRTVIIAMVAYHMGWDQAKATLWMETKNPMLGNIAPDEMIEGDRLNALYDFVQGSLDENVLKDEA